MNRTVLILMVANEARGVANVAAILHHGARLDALTLALAAAALAAALAWPLYRRVQASRRIARRLQWMA